MMPSGTNLEKQKKVFMESEVYSLQLKNVHDMHTERAQTLKKNNLWVHMGLNRVYSGRRTTTIWF